MVGAWATGILWARCRLAGVWEADARLAMRSCAAACRLAPLFSTSYQVCWCGREDSNFHGCYPTATSTLRVYQFRHDRTCSDEWGAYRRALGACEEGNDRKCAGSEDKNRKHRQARFWGEYAPCPAPAKSTLAATQPGPGPALDKSGVIMPIAQCEVKPGHRTPCRTDPRQPQEAGRTP